MVGLDDWSWKRRLRYGTLICDLESHHPIDVLPDRSVKTVSAWFETHPSVEIVSRDRSSEYAAAIKKGAPQATQVADRWHLGKNLAESIETLLARCRAEIRRGLHVQAIPEQERAGTEPVLEEEKRPARTRREEAARLARRAQKLDRYEQVLELRDQGLTTADIGPRIGVSGRTVRRWLAHGSFPEARRRRRRPSLIDPYERSVLQWWQEGNRNGLQLYRALTAQGYRGSSKAVYRYLERLRTPQRPSLGVTPSKAQKQKSVLVEPSPRENFSAQRASLSVCVSTREVRREAASRTGTDQAGQPKRRDRLRLGTSVLANDAGADGTAVGHLAKFGRSEPFARARVICQRDPTRQDGCVCRIDIAIQ